MLSFRYSRPHKVELFIKKLDLKKILITNFVFKPKSFTKVIKPIFLRMIIFFAIGGYIRKGNITKHRLRWNIITIIPFESLRA